MTSNKEQQTDHLGQGCSLDETTRQQYLKAMGIQPWFQKNAPAEELVVEVEQQHPETPVQAESIIQNKLDEPVTITDDVGQMDWQQLQKAVSQCQLCELHTTRTQTVFGVGNQEANLLIVGEAPGAEEDRLGEPFVGRAGKLLDAMMAAIDLDRSKIYIANVLKCRPPNNRNPHTSEIVCCDAYLQRQIELIQPKVILALGRIAAHHLLVSQESLGNLRRQQHSYHGIPLIVSYHPAYLLRNPVDKRKSWQDLLQIKKTLTNL